MFLNVKYRDLSDNFVKISHVEIKDVPTIGQLFEMISDMKTIVKKNGLEIVVMDWILSDSPLDKKLL